MSHALFIINGPNIQLLGLREPNLYGSTTYQELVSSCEKWAKNVNCQALIFQSDAEAELLAFIHKARNQADAILINAGAYTHTSIALYDALAFADKPLVEVHISAIHRRETFRHHSYISPLATGLISGLGTLGYKAGIEFLAHTLSIPKP